MRLFTDFRRNADNPSIGQLYLAGNMLYVLSGLFFVITAAERA